MQASNHFRYNAYDMKQFQDLLNASQVLKHYEQIGMRYFQDFQEFMFMIFLLSYKIVLTEPISELNSVAIS
ncbi:hypothetical protein [Fusibacter sp. 3D3]|uniref:hypothetical protein n=1 Tax=Fusibacter sp. 3D3 TaxID=1048380 RepID=UPI000853BD70|nr:hypothetical protein [Fusibacter sp. 3D3]GAU77086.1 hypothetical protein F3D3_1685 [Fusibacter sp. 3D3]